MSLCLMYRQLYSCSVQLHLCSCEEGGPEVQWATGRAARIIAWEKGHFLGSNRSSISIACFPDWKKVFRIKLLFSLS